MDNEELEHPQHDEFCARLHQFCIENGKALGMRPKHMVFAVGSYFITAAQAAREAHRDGQSTH